MYGTLARKTNYQANTNRISLYARSMRYDPHRHKTRKCYDLVTLGPIRFIYHKNQRIQKETNQYEIFTKNKFKQFIEK